MKGLGKHPDKALSAVRVRQQKVPGRYTDGNGLYLVVDPSGAKRWLLRTVIQGRRCDMGLGSVSLVTLAEAREKAVAYRKIAREGGDPRTVRKAAQAVIPTFSEAAERVHTEHKGSWANAKHAQQWINTLRQYACPELGKRRVDQIETSDILRVLSPIWLMKPETARRVRQRIGTVLDWAKAAGFRTGENPIDGVAKGLPKQTDRDEHHAALPYAAVPGFVANDLADWLASRGMTHVRGAPCHPQTQGKIERWHQTLKNRILLEHADLPGELETQVADFVEHYNHARAHESLSNLTPADVYFGRGEGILAERERIKRQTLVDRRLRHHAKAA